MSITQDSSVSYTSAAGQTTRVSRMADEESKVDASTSSLLSVTPESLVTEDQVRVALMSDKGTAAQLTTWKLVDFTKKGDNYCSVVTSVDVKYELDGMTSEVVYVVKINSGKTVGEDPLIDIGIQNECKFFLDIVPQLNSALREIGHKDMNFPKCFHVSLEKGKELIFLEDLRARGYKMVDRREGLDKAHTTLVVKELAKLHAASLLLQNKTPDDDLGEKYPPLKGGFVYLAMNYDSQLNVFKESAKLSQAITKKVDGYERATAWIDNIIPKLRDIFSEQTEHVVPQVVCHGDCWNNNLLFRYSDTGHPEAVMLLDLQMANYGELAVDLNFLFYTSLTGDVRKPNVEAFLHSYYTTFKDIMEAGGQTVPFTQAQLLKEFKHRNLVGLVFAMVFVPLVLFQTEGEVDTSKENKEDVAEMLRETREKSLEVIDTDPLLKPRFLSVFDEMMEQKIIP